MSETQQWHRTCNKGATAQTTSARERPVSVTNRVVSLLILLLVKLPGLSLLLLASVLPGLWSFLLVHQGNWGESGDHLEKRHSHQLQLTQKPMLLKKSLRFSMSIWGGHYRGRRVHHRHILVARCLVYWEINYIYIYIYIYIILYYIILYYIYREKDREIASERVHVSNMASKAMTCLKEHFAYNVTRGHWGAVPWPMTSLHNLFLIMIIIAFRISY